MILIFFMKITLIEISQKSRRAEFGSDIHGVVERLAEKIQRNHPNRSDLENWYQAMGAFIQYADSCRAFINEFGSVEKAMHAFLAYGAYSRKGSMDDNWFAAQRAEADFIYARH